MSNENPHILDLIDKVKKNNDDAAFLELNEIYKNLCYKIALSIYMYEDFELDKNAIFMDAIRRYDPEKQIKFATFLGTQIKYHCFNLRNKLKTSPKIYASGIMVNSDFDNTNTEFLDFESYKKCEINDEYNFLHEKIQSLDEGEKKLIELRYFNPDKLGWRDIGKQLGMSGQAALNQCNRILKELRKDIPQQS